MASPQPLLTRDRNELATSRKRSREAPSSSTTTVSSAPTLRIAAAGEHTSNRIEGQAGDGSMLSLPFTNSPWAKDAISVRSVEAVLSGKTTEEGEEMRGKSAIFFIVYAPWILQRGKRKYDDLMIGDTLSDLATLHGAELGKPLPQGMPHVVTVDVNRLPDAAEVLQLTVSALPSVVIFSRLPGTTGPFVKTVEKALASPMQLYSLVSFTPVFSVDDLYAYLTNRSCHDRNNSNSNGFTVVYYGASWCRPCMSIVPQLHGVIQDINRGRAADSIVSIVKADKDHAQSLCDLMGVVKIPSFQVFSAQQLKEVGQAKGGTPAAALCPKDSLQNSNPAAVKCFIERNTTVLSFGTGDEDF